MRWSWIWLLVAVGLQGACDASLGLPAGSSASCRNDGDCPDDLVCRNQVCARPGDDPATLTFGAIARSVGDVTVPVTVFDDTTGPVRVTLEYDEGEGVFTASTQVETGLAASPGGERHDLVWHSAADLGDTAYRSRVRLRLIAHDERGPGTPAISPEFTVGNDAPTWVSLSADAVGGVVSGMTTLRLVVSDSSADPIRITAVELSADEQFASFVEVPLSTGAGGNFPSGGLAAIPTSVSGASAIVPWNSAQSSPIEQDGMRIRVWVTDGASAPISAIAGPYALRNLPVIESASAALPGNARHLVDVPIGVVVADPNGTPNGDSLVDVAVEFSLDYVAHTGLGAWYPATLSTSGDGLSLTAPVAGAAHTVVWDALADVGTAGLTSTLVDADGDGIPETLVLAARAGVWLRLVPTNSASAEGEAVVLGPIEFGNDAPIATPENLTGTFRGDIPLELTLKDSSGDPANIQLQYRPNGLAWTAATVSRGPTVDLASSAGGRSHVIVWDSLADIGLHSYAQVELRLRAIDHPAVGVLHHGPWVPATSTFAVLNQQPPQVRSVFIKSDGDLRNGVVPILYDVIDEELDVADVEVEYSLDHGLHWYACTEYHAPQSEGLFGLATVDVETGGMRHRFYWDASADLMQKSLFTSVRMTASDAFGTGEPTLVLQDSPAGPPAVAPNDALFYGVLNYAIGERPSPGGGVADFDQDGILDVAVCNTFGDATNPGGSLSVLRGSGSGGVGNGGFFAATSYGLSFPDDLAIADVNGDNDPDLVSLSGGAVQVFLGGAGTAFVTPARTFGSLGLSPKSAAVGDFNSDGIADLALGGAGKVGVLLGQGTGGSWTFAATANVYSVSAGDYPYVAVGDLNGDGRDDLVAVVATSSQYQLGTLEVFFGAGTASVGNGQLVAGPVLDVGGNPADVLTTDFDNDGLDDIAFTQAEWGSLSVALSAGTLGGSDWSVDHLDSFGSGADVHGLTRGDFNGDGIWDLAAASFSDSAATLFLGRGANGVGDGSFIAGPRLLGEAWTWSAVAGDFLEDGFDDLAIISGENSVAGSLSVHRSRPTTAVGAGSLAAAQLFPSLDLAQNVYPADYNVDGAMDTIVSGENGYPGNLALLTGWASDGVGLGVMNPPLVLPAHSAYAYGHMWGDFNGDGIVDVLSTSNTSYTVQLMLGGGSSGVADGTFGASTTVATQSGTGNYPERLAVADIDGDGDLDFVTDAAQSVMVYRQNAGGSFTLSQTLAATTGFTSRIDIILGDFNGDAAVDIAASVTPGTSASAVHRVYVYLNGVSGGLPTGTFTSGTAHDVASVVRGLTAGDFNSDGIVDLALIHTELFSTPGVDKVTLMLGNAASPGLGNGTFAAPGSTIWASDGNYPGGIVATDVDRDGILDLVVTDRGTSGVRVFEGYGSGGFGNGTFAAPVFFETGSASSGLAVADFNSDATADLWVANRGRGQVAVLTGRREDFRDGSIRGITPFTTTAGSGNGVGVAQATGEQHLDGSGSMYSQGFSLRRVGHPADAGPLVNPAHVFANTFRDMLRLSRLAHPGALQAVSMAWEVSGDVRLARVRDGAGSRIKVENRFGPRTASGDDFGRGGLDLAPSSGLFADQRGVVVDLTILAGRSSASMSGKTVRVYMRTLDWVRASAVAGDPLHGTSAGNDYLPRVVGGGGFRDVFKRTETWREIPRASGDNLALGTGPRFAVDLSDSANRRIRVLLDEFGMLQAFMQP